MDTDVCSRYSFIETHHPNRASLGVDLFIQQILVKCPLQDIPSAEDTAINKTGSLPP